jgi:hypothetical protein
MVLVEEATMNHGVRTAAVGAALLTAGLAAGLAIESPAATATERAPTPPTAVAMPTAHIAGLDQMMNGDMSGTDHVGSMMGGANMTAMHTAMHEQMAGVVDADVLAACDTAHGQMAGMTSGDASTAAMQEATHAAHHEEIGS